MLESIWLFVFDHKEVILILAGFFTAGALLRWLAS